MIAEFHRTLDSVQGNPRLAEASVAEEAAAALDATDKDVSIGGAGLAAAASTSASSPSCACSAIRSSSVAARPSCHRSPVTEDVGLDLVEPKAFGWHVIYERYRQDRDESD